MAVHSSVETMDLEEADSRANTPMWLQSGKHVDGSGEVDFRGLGTDKSKTGGWPASAFIHLLLTGDATAIFGIAGNLVPYLLSSLRLPPALAFTTVSNFVGTVYLLPIFWGYLADAYFGNYSTIGGSSIICFSGLLVLFLSTTVPGMKPAECVPGVGVVCTEASASSVSWFKAGLYLTAVGAAGLLPCGTSMGQDQFDETDEAEKKQGSYFFTSFYANINFTALLCVTLLFWIQDHFGYDWGYGVITGIYFVGVACFFLATPLFRHRLPAGSALTRAGQVVVASAMNMWKRLPDHPSDLYELEDDEATIKGVRKIVHTDKLRFLDKAAIVPPVNTLGPEDSGKIRRKLVCTVTQVEELKTVIQILPIWLCCISVYTVFAQLMGVTLQQAQSLDRHIGRLNVPPASSGAILMITAMVTIPIYDFILVPYLRKRTGHPQGMSDLKRMGVALFAALLAMIAAALVEDKRVKVIARHNVTLQELVGGATIPMRIYWLFPQYSLLGIVEFLLGVAQLNFFYKETPDSMRGLATALYFTSVSVGYFAASGLVETVNKYTESSGGGWLAGEIITGGLKKFYILLAIIMVINWFLFLLFSHWYTYKKVVTEKDPAAVTSRKNVEDGHSKQSTEMSLKGQGGPTDHVPASDLKGTRDENSEEFTLRISMIEAAEVASEADNAGTTPKVLKDESSAVSPKRTPEVPNDESKAVSSKETPAGTKSDHHLELPVQSKLD